MASQPQPGATTIPLPDPSHPGIAALRSALWAAGYDTDRVREAFSAQGDSLTPSVSQMVLLARQLEKGRPLTTLLTLFLLDQSVPIDEARRALAPLSIDAATEMGVLDERDGQVHARVRLIPYAGLVFACSLTPESLAVAADHVMGITRSTTELANLTIRRPVQLALDLCCGTGVQALLASRHATRVIATDYNPAACRFTEFNCRLNRVDNVEVRQGSYFEPVEGMQFDLVATNPPFVISPETRFLYRDSEMPGDSLSETILREVARHLAPGGLATVLISWGRHAGDDWDARPRQWVEGLGCDALLLHQATQTALGHSASWHGMLSSDPRAFAEGIDRWAAHLATLGFEGVAYGAVVLRRRDGATWVRTEEMPGNDAGPADAQLEAMFTTQDTLAGLPNHQALLDLRLALVPNHHLQQTMRFREGKFTVENALITLEDGLPFGANVDAFTAFLLARLDGSRTLREAAAEAAPVAPEEAAPAEVEASAVRAAHRMLEMGLLRVSGVTMPAVTE